MKKIVLSIFVLISSLLIPSENYFKAYASMNGDGLNIENSDKTINVFVYGTYLLNVRKQIILEKKI